MTRDEAIALCELVRRSGSVLAATRRAFGEPGMSEANLRRRLVAAKALHGMTPENLGESKPRVSVTADFALVDAPQPEFDGEDRRRPDPIVVRLQEKVRRLERRLKDAEQAGLSTEEVRRSIMGLAEVPEDPPSWLVDTKKQPGHPGTPVAHWSDWHWGEVVNSATINGLNSFSIEIGEHRVRRLVERTIDLCYSHVAADSFPGIVVMLGGDMVTGEIHHELATSNDDYMLPTVLRLRDTLIWALSATADRFGRVFVPCVSGNHGRTTHRVEYKNFVYKNFDWLIYSLLERHFTSIGDRRIQFYIPPSNEALFRVHDTRYLMLHGHDLGVKGGDGIIGAIGPIMRGAMKVGRQQAEVGRQFDCLVVGHWHQCIPLKKLKVNNTLKGFDEFANVALRAPFSEPSQSLWFTHPRRGPNVHFDVCLDDDQTPSGEQQAWVSLMDGAA